MKRNRRIICLIMLVCAVAMSACMIKKEAADYYFHADGVDVIPGVSGADVIGRLGEARFVQSSPSCAFDGEERIYHYTDFDVYTSYENGRETVERVVITGNTVATERGIRVGDSLYDVVRSYGRDYEKKGENIEYDGEQCDMQFFFKDGIVTSIRYLADD